MIKVYKVTSKLLNQKRNISIYIPDSTKGPYRVLYMHDGQNLFFKENSFAGEIWDMHTQAERLIKAGLIRPLMIVGIDNTKFRMDEYAPFDNSTIYLKYPDTYRVKFYGDNYMRFIVNELKPWVDKKFPTLKEKEDTMLAGSSLGGLISLYGGLMYPNVFGGLALLSTSSWWNETGLSALLSVKKPSNTQNYFISCGSNESGSLNAKDNRKYIHTTKKIYKALKPNINHSLHNVYDGGIHNEPFWASQVSEFLQFLNKK